MPFVASASGPSHTLPVPAGVASGDVLLASFILNGNWTVSSVPAGWTLLRSTSSGAAAPNRQLVTYVRSAGGSEPASYAWTFSGGTADGVMTAWRGVYLPVEASGGAAQVGSAGTVPAPSITTTSTGALLVMIGSVNTSGAVSFTPPAGMTERVDTAALPVGEAYVVADETQASPGVTGTRNATVDIGASTNDTVGQLLAFTTNVAPNAPTLTAPVGSTTINKDATYRFDWDFSDPDAGDSQSKFDLRYRLTSGGTWTDVTGTTPNTFYDMPAGTLAAGDYEWQVRTYDSQGVVGPYSASAFFTAASTPGVPSITAPIAGETISQDTAELTWSTPSQEAYRVRKVADNAGVPDTGTVYYDSGEVVSASARSATLTFPVNNRVEHLQLSVRDGGLWSSWASVNVTVSYTPPPVPDVTVTSDGGALTVQVTNLPADPGEPAVIGNYLWRREVVGGVPTDPIRLKNLTTGEPLMVTPGGSYTDWAVASRREYEYRPQAVGDNGTSSFGHWPGTVVVSSYDDVAATFDTYDELPLFFDTYADLAAGSTS